MSFAHACFISYRWTQHDPGQAFMTQFCDVLAGEIELLTDLDVYRDEDDLGVGDLVDQKVAEALCRSVCMVLVYTPRYFSIKHPYCAREYQAMVGLEQARREILSAGEGLIFPVVLRGPRRLPSALSVRWSLDFSQFTLASAELSRHSRFAPQIRDLAGRIASRCERAEQADLSCGPCDQFKLPSEEDVRELITTMRPASQPFPRRELP